MEGPDRGVGSQGRLTAKDLPGGRSQPAAFRCPGTVARSLPGAGWRKAWPGRPEGARAHGPWNGACAPRPEGCFSAAFRQAHRATSRPHRSRKPIQAMQASSGKAPRSGLCRQTRKACVFGPGSAIRRGAGTIGPACQTPRALGRLRRPGVAARFHKRTMSRQGQMAETKTAILILSAAWRCSTRSKPHKNRDCLSPPAAPCRALLHLACGVTGRVR